MTYIEIIKQALSLPRDQQAEIVETLLKSLGGPLDLAAHAEAAGIFEDEGEPKEMTDEDWQKLRCGEYQYPAESDGLATPPGWFPPRLKRPN